MVLYVIKRDGSKVPFQGENIIKAIEKAMARTEQGVDTEIAKRISKKIESRYEAVLEVEKIQDLVENELMNSARKDVAKAYIKYRAKRDIARQSKSKVMFDEIINIKDNEVTRENANMNADTPAGMMMKFASETTKPFVDAYLISEEAKEAVQENLIHIHDKDYYPTKSLTCLQHPLDVIFKKGFRAGHGELRPPKRLETAAIQACISMETTQNEMHGGQAIPAFDFYLAPFVRQTYLEEVDKIRELIVDTPDPKFWDPIRNAKFTDYVVRPLPTDVAVGGPCAERIIQMAMNQTVNRVHQAMESFVHNMNNIHSRGGNQVVFSSINYGTDTSAEGRCIIREILKATERGVGNGATAIFPIQIWKLKAGVSYLPGDPNYDLYKRACEVTAKRFFPNFLNLDASYNKTDAWKADDPKRYEHEVATMGCRTRIWGDRFGESTSIGRGNLSFTTINLPKIAIQSAIKVGILVQIDGFVKKTDVNGVSRKGRTEGYISIFDSEYEKYTGFEKPSKRQSEKMVRTAIKEFYNELERVLVIAAKQLDDRYQFQATALAQQFPLLMGGLWKGSENLKPSDTIESVIKHGTLGVGFIGLAEALTALLGEHHGESEYAQEEGLKIVSYIDKRCKDFSDIFDHNYSCFATPAEGLSGKFTRVDRKVYGTIAGVLDKDYYTNSNHVPVGYRCSAKHKMEVEGPYHKLTPAGHIAYIEVDGDIVSNPEAVMDMVDIMVKNDVGYGSINHNQIRCNACSFESASEEDFPGHRCPECASDDVTHLQRITGYLTTDVRKWNSGKKAEFHDRVKHD